MGEDSTNGAKDPQWKGKHPLLFMNISAYVYFPDTVSHANHL